MMKFLMLGTASHNVLLRHVGPMTIGQLDRILATAILRIHAVIETPANG